MFLSTDYNEVLLIRSPTGLVLTANWSLLQDINAMKWDVLDRKKGGITIGRAFIANGLNNGTLM